MRLELHDCLTSKNMAIAVQKHLNTSASSYRNSLTAFLIFHLLGVEILQPLSLNPS